MENTKLFKDDISDKLYKNIINFATEIHDQKRNSDKIKNKMNTTFKLSKVAALTSLGLTLGTIANIAVNYYTKNPDIYNIAVESMVYGGISSLVALTTSFYFNKKVNQLDDNYHDASYRNNMNDVLRYVGFEKTLVSDLKNIGIDVKEKNIMTVAEFTKIRDMNGKKEDIDSELKAKTTEFVKSLMEEYTKPEVVVKTKKNTP